MIMIETYRKQNLENNLETNYYAKYDSSHDENRWSLCEKEFKREDLKKIMLFTIFIF